MTINGTNLVKQVAKLLQDQMLISALDGADPLDDLSVQKLDISLRDALSELAVKFPVYTVKTVAAVAGKIPMSLLKAGESTGDIQNEISFRVMHVTKNGRHVPFSVTGTAVIVDGDGTYEVAIAPDKFDKGIGDQFELSDEIALMTVIHLIARNYCIFSGRTEEAAMYDSRYSDYAEAISLKRRAHIPARRFV